MDVSLLPSGNSGNTITITSLEWTAARPGQRQTNRSRVTESEKADGQTDRHSQTERSDSQSQIEQMPQNCHTKHSRSHVQDQTRSDRDPNRDLNLPIISHVTKLVSKK